MAIRAVAGNWTMFRSKEMCHEEINRRSRADLTDRDPFAHRECKRSPYVPVEVLIREQRLLTISGTSERFCSRLKTWHSQGGRLALASAAALPLQDQSCRRALLLAAVPGHGPYQWRGWIVRMNARAIKAKQGRLKVVARG